MRFPLAVLAFAAATITVAAPITYTAQFTGSGTFASSAFTNQLVTFTFEGDTDNVTILSPGVYLNAGIPGSVTVAGIGQGVFTNNVAAVVNQGLGRAGFSDLTQNVGIAAFDNSAFSTYTLSTAIGPLAITSALGNTVSDFPTTLGSFKLTSIGGAMTYTATMPGSEVPEPSSAALAGIGVALAAWYRRRRATR